MEPEASTITGTQPVEAPATPSDPAGTVAETPGRAATTPAPATRQASGPRWQTLAVLAAVAVAAIVTLVVVLEYGGGAYEALPADLAGADPGAVTGWGLPITRLLSDIAGVACVGTLLAAAFLLPASGGKPGAAGRRMLRLGSISAWVWCVAALAEFAFDVSDLIGRPLPGALTTHNIDNVLRSVAQPRALLIVAAVAFVVAVGAGTAHKLDTCAWLTVGAIAALLPVATTGHAHGNGGHDLATVSGGLHIIGASVWVGGLGALLVAGRSLAPAELRTAVTRYSRLAALCLLAVTVSGVVNAYVRVAAFHELWDSRYGNLVIAKTVALLVLAGFGAAHRRFTLRRLADDTTSRRGPFLRLGAVEVVVMGVAIALGAGLSQSATPAASEGPTSNVVATLGYPLPPEFSVTRMFTEARLDLFFLGIVLAAAGYYITWVVRLYRAGASWPVGRTISWLAGLTVVAFVTNSGLGSYGRVLFSAHMAQHLLLMMLAPILLNLGAPVSLALRALPTGVTGTTRSARAWLMRIVNSRWMAFVSNPIVAWLLYAVSLYVLYLTPLFGWVMSNHLAHLAMMLHFLATGYLFYWILIGIDPGPNRPGYPARIIMLFTASAVHTFFGIIVMMSSSVIGESYYSLLARAWGSSLIDDQHLGGGMAWSFGELPGVAVIGALVFQWARSDERRARAKDARMDSGDDDEFDRYNDYLAGLANKGRRPTA